ncbi:hypothetical protein JQ557_17585 [Bradyrhizobium sp. U87765 SZCCT0131]|uniref:hypothetical protein n=1 Tax=unclassified Bradyrhizobium TaxID=2631580 RepID=UPI001BA5F4BD|nr:MULTISPECIES: hypothetical protein [unclassified Bradyrhizobium]MBR1219824.1 hypothetical protein [Bradyrhizobium sp. U87765 SZCCT0131]MBR1262475.1 hypothetical protein [Bradyrhizobium sp. U87765 SZCCT0134]MBR1308342.1 hypothetical protein [Bradyrhizobium sp. U87765 SZCCT0110]MBR1318257.1 hypothetical protein [Bradyrhizobium sp. U87765 SZCCT0109]MBR1351960.1 hypothetical protein [Bradyrhizobium sp. U87765 SZCCT0048]
MTVTFRRLRAAIAAAALTMTICGLPLAAATTAHADACDDLAKQLTGQIDGLVVGATSANAIALKHPAVSRASLGCRSRNVTNEVFAATASRKPSDAFYGFTSQAAALVFTIPRDDVRKGIARCIGRIGLLRGDTIATRYRRLDIRCTGSKAGTTVSVSRELDS